MSSLFKSTKNTRIVPGFAEYIRSDLPQKLTDNEIDWLISYGVRTLIDLRSKDEYEKWPCCLEHDNRFTIMHMPLLENIKEAKCEADMSEVYRNMLNDNLTNILDTMLNLSGRVMYFCYTGKDRTGVVTAMLMRRFAVSPSKIAKDYMQSKVEMEQWIVDFCNRNPEHKLEVCMPNIKFIQPILDGAIR